MQEQSPANVQRAVTVKTKLNRGLTMQGNDDSREATRNALYQIEDKFKLLKHLPNQQLHPFDLTQDDLQVIKSKFPEFHPSHVNATRKAHVKGIDIGFLKSMLAEKLKKSVTAQKLEQIIQKLDRRSTDHISWREFLSNMDAEGVTREAVNDAQLYGFGVKRFIQKGRFFLSHMDQNAHQDMPKSTDSNIGKLLYLKNKQMNLVLAVFEDNKVCVYDMDKEFKAIQEIKFEQKFPQSKSAAAPTANVVRDFQKSSTKIMNRRPTQDTSPNPSTIVRFAASNQPSDYVPQSQSNEVGKKSVFSNNRYSSSGRDQELPKINKKLMSQKVQRVNNEFLRQESSDSRDVQTYKGHPNIIAYKSQKQLPKRASSTLDQSSMHWDKIQILGKGEEKPIRKDSLTQVTKKSQQDESQTYLHQYDNFVDLNDFHPNYKQQCNMFKIDFKRKCDETQKFCQQATADEKVYFDRLLKKERDRGFEEKQCILNVSQNLKYNSEQVHQLDKEKQQRMMAQSQKEQKRCEIRLDKLQSVFKGMDNKLQELRKINQIKIDKAYEHVSPEPASIVQRQEQASTVDKVTQRKMNAVHRNKTVHVTACDYNTEFNILVLALIDKEIKVYQVKQSGTKVNLVEMFSFMANFPQGEHTTCLQVEKYVSNGRQILCMGSVLGDVCIVYLDDPQSKREMKGGPTIVARFQFIERGFKPNRNDYQDIGSDCELPTGIPQNLNEDSFFDQSNVDKSGGATFISNKRLHKSNTQRVSKAQMNSAQLINDEYWSSVMMGVKEKGKGMDGIQIWNSVYPLLEDIEQTTALVKELSSLEIYDQNTISLALQAWNQCYKLAKQDLDQATKTFRVEVQQIVNPQVKHNFNQTTKFRRKAYDPYTPSPQVKLKRSVTSLNQTPALSKLNSILVKRQNSLFNQSDANLSQGAQITKSDAGEHQEQKVIKQTKKGVQTTGIKYIKDIGLIVTTFDGQIKIFDAFGFYLVWRNTNKQRGGQHHTTITSFDVSPQLGLMAIGGVEGRIVLIDPYAFGMIGSTEAHIGVEVTKVVIYSSQQQVLSIAQDRAIHIYDAFRLTKIQTIREDSVHSTFRFYYADFDQDSGKLFVADQQLCQWNAEVDGQSEIEALQVQTLSRAFLKDRNMGELDKLSGKTGQQKESKGLRNGRVTVARSGQLVRVLMNHSDLKSLVVTIDSENLLRGWSMYDSTTSFSYKIPMANRVTAAVVSDDNRFLAVGTQSGEVCVLNFLSGGLLYTLPSQDKEISQLAFLLGPGEFWLVATTWGGRLVFWTEPTADNNYQISAKSSHGHDGDILVLDRNDSCVVTGGVDGFVIVWNQFSGVKKLAFGLPEPQAEIYKNKKQNSIFQKHFKKISQVMFHPFFSNLVMVLQESGNVHLVEITNGTIIADFIAQMKNNSVWACCLDKQRMFVVGESGFARTFDIRLKKQNQTMQVLQREILKRAKKSPVYKDGPIKDYKWESQCPWFVAHEIDISENNYVNSVAFSKTANVFVSGTSKGEVKIWSNQDQPLLLSTINSSGYDSRKLLSYVKKMIHFKNDSELSSYLDHPTSSTQQTDVEVQFDEN